MIATAATRIRAAVALALFATGGGGEQLIDALLFHGGQARPEVARINAGDHCHAERCELGAPIASPPPIALPDIGDRFEPVFRRAEPPVPADAPRSLFFASPVGSRAPPTHS